MSTLFARVGGAWVPVSSGGVPTSRLISTTAPLTGGGDLSADRTLAINPFAGSAPGAVPTSLGGIANFLRADGAWSDPRPRCGAAATASQSVASGTNPAITFTNEVYDSDGFINPPSTVFTVPAAKAGIYAAALSITASAAPSANSLVRLLIQGSNIWQNTMVAGQTMASVCWVGSLGVGGTVGATFWNAGTAAVTASVALELNRVSS